MQTPRLLTLLFALLCIVGIYAGMSRKQALMLTQHRGTRSANQFGS